MARVTKKVRKPDIKIYWSKKEKDFMVWGSSTRFCGTGSLFMDNLGGGGKRPILFPDLLKELDNRGYDLTTLKIQIAKKADADTPASEL